jgi:hypothetical protein
VFILPQQPFEVSALLSPALDPTRQYSSSKNGLALVGNSDYNRALVSTVITDCDEEECLDVLVRNILETGSHTRQTMGAASSNSVVLRSALSGLRHHASALTALVQRVPSAAHAPTFLDVGLDESVAGALKDKTVIEYPTFFVGCPADTAKMQRFIAELDCSTEATATGDGDVIPMDGSESPGKKARLRGTEELGARAMENGEVRGGMKEEEEEEDNDDDEEVDPEEANEFLRVMVELENADTAALQSMIEEDS